MHRLGSLLLGGWVVGALALTSGCRSTPELTPSPLPPAYAQLMKSGGPKQASKAPRGRRKGERVLDGVIASVGDKFLTRREAERRLRLNAKDDSTEADRDVEIDQMRVEWAKQQLLVKAARQAGIAVPAARLDEYAEDRLRSMIKGASEELGAPISRDAYLAERRLTWEEFTSQMRDDLMSQLYVAKLRDGIQGTRPVIDRAVSPSEVRRVYRENRELFNIKSGAKIVLFQFNTKGVADDDHTPVEWEALAKRRAEQLSGLFRQGYSPKMLARRYDLNDSEVGTWRMRPVVEPRETLAKLVNKEFEVWMLDPNLRVRDTFIANDSIGPLVVGIMELEQARVLPYSEAHDRIVNRIRQGMHLNLEARLIIDMISRGAVVSPPDLEDLLLDAEHEALDIIAADPILKSARLQ